MPSERKDEAAERIHIFGMFTGVKNLTNDEFTSLVASIPDPDDT